VKKLEGRPRYDSPRPGFKRKTVFVRPEVWTAFSIAAKAQGNKCADVLNALLLSYIKEARERHGSSD
jgi:hypothetical protein